MKRTVQEQVDQAHIRLALFCGVITPETEPALNRELAAFNAERRQKQTVRSPRSHRSIRSITSI